MLETFIAEMCILEKETSFTQSFLLIQKERLNRLTYGINKRKQVCVSVLWTPLALSM